MRFRAKNAGYGTGLYQVYATSYWAPVVQSDGRTDGRTDDHMTIPSLPNKISWLDRLPNLLINSAPLARYA